MSKRIRKYNLPDSCWDTPEPISLSELKQQAGGKSLISVNFSHMLNSREKSFGFDR